MNGKNKTKIISGKIRNDISARFFRKFGFWIYPFGICFKHKKTTDELTWLFWWARDKRYRNKSIYSSTWGMYFNNLKEYDKYNDEVAEDLRILEEARLKKEGEWIDGDFENEYDFC